LTLYWNSKILLKESSKLSLMENYPQNRTTPRFIDKLEKNEIFVFGSNLEGNHGGGAAHEILGGIIK